MNTAIEVTARSVYGNVLLYPANQQARLLAQITETMTLTVRVLAVAASMGFIVNVIGDESAARKGAALIKELSRV